MSAKWVNRDNEMLGPQYMIRGGYKKVVEAYSKGLDFHLNCPISSINYEGEEVRVETESGNAYTAKQVVITVPLGVLKAKRILFRPELPRTHSEAIDRMGWAIYEKVVMEFKEAFWDIEANFIKYLLEGSDLACFEFFNIHKFHGRPILVCFLKGDHARELLHKRTLDEVTSLLYGELLKVYPKATPPIRSFRTEWALDPYVLGGYSFPGKNSDNPDDQQLLARPIQDKVFISGEAVATHFQGCAHGAYLSGVEVAERIRKGLDERTKKEL